MNHPLSELIDLVALKALMESLYRATGINYALIDNDSRVHVAVGWARLCTDFHRANPSTCQRCEASDRHILNHLRDGPYIGYDCPNGLVDYATPVVIGGEHVANVFTGQMLHAQPDMARFASQAAQFGFDTESYLEAVREVRIVPKERMPAVMAFLVELAQMMGRQGLERLRQLEVKEELRRLNLDLSERVARRTEELSEKNRLLARKVDELKQAGGALGQEKQFSDDIINSLPGVFYLLDQRGFVKRWNRALCEVSGYGDAEVADMHALQFFDVDDGALLQERIGEVFARGESTLEARLLTKDGLCVPYYFSGRRTYIDGQPYVVGLGIDITVRKQAEERIQYLAHFDVLTGLPNRAQLAELAACVIGLARRNDDPVALMFLDIDHFKDINDTLGHSIGDVLLVELAGRLRRVLRNSDTVSRLGGDEFVFLLHGVDARGAAEVAQMLLEVLAVPVCAEHYDLNVTASIGIAMYPGDGEDLEALSRSADSAMYRVKQEGRNGYRFFTAEMQARSTRHLRLANALRLALEKNELQVHYQPQVAMQDERLIGAEALLRWTHPELGVVSPAEFIPVAEDSGLILAIGEWVLRQAVRQTRRWLDQGMAPLVMAVNLSAVQFRHPDLPALVSRILDEEGVPPACLELELTEGVAMRDPQGAIMVMNNLHGRGVRMSIDDFGTGYSSLSHLKRFKIRKLKIDQSFVRDICDDPEDKAIVGAIIQMAKSLGLYTIAEGVETAGQLAFLREQGCDEIQGYFYSKPLTAGQFEAFARERGDTAPAT
jgi:diguanylate cyclase (GGDEF)-like protein/PAS domain S-box-containing protein